MKIFITLAGGWDKTLDEIPEPTVLMEADLPQAIDEMIDAMVSDPGIDDEGAENIYPLSISTGLPHNEIRNRALKLIGVIRESSADNIQLEPEWIDLHIMMKEELLKHGRLEMMQFWDCYEGSFYGIFAREI